MRFEWDSRKAESNLQKHGVSFAEASTAFGDPLSLTIPDPEHSVDEPRYVLVGFSFVNRLLVVIHTDREEAVRIISVRLATKSEHANYETELSP